MNNCVVCNGKDPSCQYCNGTGIIVNTESDEQLMAILKSNERPKVVIIEDGDDALQRKPFHFGQAILRRCCEPGQRDR